MNRDMTTIREFEGHFSPVLLALLLILLIELITGSQANGSYADLEWESAPLPEREHHLLPDSCQQHREAA